MLLFEHKQYLQSNKAESSMQMEKSYFNILTVKCLRQQTNLKPTIKLFLSIQPAEHNSNTYSNNGVTLDYLLVWSMASGNLLDNNYPHCLSYAQTPHLSNFLYLLHRAAKETFLHMEWETLFLLSLSAVMEGESRGLVGSQMTSGQPQQTACEWQI